MLECSVYKNIVSNLSESVVLVKPLYTGRDIHYMKVNPTVEQESLPIMSKLKNINITWR